MKKPALIILVLATTLLGSNLTTQALAATLNFPSDCTPIQACIHAASSGDTVNIPSGTFVEHLIINNKDLTLQGAGADLTIIDGGGNGRVVSTGGAINVQIADVTIQNGNAVSAGGILINNTTIAIVDSTIRGNVGGGIYNTSGTVTILNTTVSGNTSGGGGGIYNSIGTIDIINSTISGNTANVGGGIYSVTSGLAIVTLTNSTISGNTANSGSGIYTSFAGTATLSNSILNDSCGGTNPLNSNGYNLYFPAPACGITGLGTGDVVGAPLIGPLANNGGTTQTHLPLTGSPAIEAGDCDSGTVTEDQRGVARPQGANCDIGAVEVEVQAQAFTCEGFESPLMDGRIVKVKKNRTLPFKAYLLDGFQYVASLAAPPVIQVIFDNSVLPAEDVTSEALSAGAGTEGNQFEFLDGKWQFNLKTKNYTAVGMYTVTMESGDSDAYLINPTCTGTFVIE